MADVERSLPSLIRSIDTTPEMTYAEEIFAHVRKVGSITKSQLFRTFARKFKDAEQFNRTLQTGQISGIIDLVPRNGKLLVVYIQEENDDRHEEEPFNTGRAN
jgi:hypothetical protein